nr:phosphopantetheine-binding protein [Streptomyces avermitilis]
MTDGFFALGGDSISSMQLASRARRAGLIVTPGRSSRRRPPNASRLWHARPQPVRRPSPTTPEWAKCRGPP